MLRCLLSDERIVLTVHEAAADQREVEVRVMKTTSGERAPFRVVARPGEAACRGDQKLAGDYRSVR